MNTDVLVTGGLGYLGGRISTSLIESGFNVFSGTRREGIKRPDWSPNLQTRHINWLSIEQLASACSGVGCIIHLASANEIECELDPVAAIQSNVNNIIRLLDAAIVSGVQRFIYISTAHVYGSPLIGRIDEKTITRPSHPYAISHRMAEDFVLAMTSKAKIQGIVLRVSNGFGYPLTNKIDRWTLLVNDLCRQLASTKKMVLKGTGQQVRDFITITDIAHAVTHVMKLESSFLGDGLFNLGGNTTLSVIAMARRIGERWQRLTGECPEIIPTGIAEGFEEALDYRCDKLLATGYSPIRNFEEELDYTLSFCQNSFVRL